MTSYERALRRLLEVPSSPRLGLGRIEELLAGLGDPHRALVVLHVAGTNGKGSVCALVDAVLGAAGRRRGFTSSPHLTSATERIRIDGNPIAASDFCELEEQVAGVAAAMADPPTFFERMVAMAFLAFVRAEVEVAVVEVGLGGRLDATNVVVPRATAITPIGLDHQRFLGETLGEIAEEKAGILKPGAPAVSAPQPPEARTAIDRVAEQRGVVVDHVGDHILIGMEEEGASVRRRGEVLAEPFELLLAGFHQIENAALALALLDVAGLLPSPEVAARGLREARWPGRFEITSEETGKLEGTWVLDGAHNAEAAAALGRTLVTSSSTRRRPVYAVVGATTGHDTELFARALGEPPVRTWATKASAPRSVDAGEVQGALKRAGWPRVRAEELGDALHAAAQAARKDDGIVLVTGSLYLVGEVRSKLALGGAMQTDPVLPLF